MLDRLLRSLLTTPSVSFQTVCDLHLEVNRQYPSYDIPVCAKHLILAGDVGRLADYDDYRNSLQKQTDRFELVFLVLGNHEFYHGSFAAGLEKARRLEQEPFLNGRLIFLHQGRYDVPESNVTVLGCTLWSKVPLESRDNVHLKIKDFQTGPVDAKLVRFRASLNLIQAVGMVVEPHSVAKSEFLLSIRDIV